MVVLLGACLSGMRWLTPFRARPWIADGQSGEGDLAQCLDQGSMVLRGVMAAQANGPCQLAAQVGQGCGRLVDQGGQTCPLLVLGQSPQAAFAGCDGHGIGDHQGRVTQLAGQRWQQLLQKRRASDVEQFMGIGLGHGAWLRSCAGCRAQAPAAVVRSVPAQWTALRRTGGAGLAAGRITAQRRGGHDLPVVQLAALDTQRRHLVVAPRKSSSWPIPPASRSERVKRQQRAVNQPRSSQGSPQPVNSQSSTASSPCSLAR